jgi:hypothetical protein
MKIFLVMLTVIMFSFTACNSDENVQTENTAKNEIKSEAHIAKVIDKIDTGNYTYLQVSENKRNYWIAVPLMKIDPGETVYFSKYMEMTDFRSETIDRTFSSILFVEDARKSATPDHMKQVHSGAITMSKKNVNIEPLEHGYTIEQIYDKKEDLNGQLVQIKGEVVKYNPRIMKRNWIHIQDGTGDSDNYDLVVTSQDQVKVGDVIIVEGRLYIDKDFGAGYFFPVLIEEAKIEID